MKSMTKSIKAISLTLVMALALCVIAMPTAYANAETVSETATVEPKITLLTTLSGDLQSGETKSKTFNVSSSAGAAIRVVYSSSSQVGNQYAPIRVKIDGSTIATSNGYSAGDVIWNLTPGNHTLTVENIGNVWLAFAISVSTLY